MFKSFIPSEERTSPKTTKNVLTNLKPIACGLAILSLILIVAAVGRHIHDRRITEFKKAAKATSEHQGQNYSNDIFSAKNGVFTVIEERSYCRDPNIKNGLPPIAHYALVLCSYQGKEPDGLRRLPRQSLDAFKATTKAILYHPNVPLTAHGTRETRIAVLREGSRCNPTTEGFRFGQDGQIIPLTEAQKCRNYALIGVSYPGIIAPDALEKLNDSDRNDFERDARITLAHQKLSHGNNALGTGKNQFSVLERGVRIELSPVLKNPESQSYAIVYWPHRDQMIEVSLKSPQLSTHALK